MWTLTNQWDLQITTGMNTGRYRPQAPSVTWHFGGVPIWATTSLSTICLNDDDDDFAGIYFTEYSWMDEHRVVRTENVDEPYEKFKKSVRIGSETMTSLTYEADSTNIGARDVVSVQFWQRS